MVMFMKANGRTIKPTGLADICIRMELSMKDTGKKINSMEKEKRRGQMVHSMRATMLMERKMEVESSNGLMVQLMMESS